MSDAPRKFRADVVLVPVCQHHEGEPTLCPWCEVERLREALDKPLRETILAVLRTMPAEAAPEHLAAMIEWQVKGWQKWQNITAFPSENQS